MRAALFDVDGVLLDSYAGYREVWTRWCTLRDVDIELAWAATHGRRPVETVAEVAPHLLPLGWGVVTSGQRRTVLSRFSAAGLPHPTVLVDGDDVAEGKPSPEGYLLAARLLGVPPGNCLVLEDAPAGVRAGKSASMRVLAVASTHTVAELAEADDSVASLADAGPVVRGWLAPDGGVLCHQGHE